MMQFGKQGWHLGRSALLALTVLGFVPAANGQAPAAGLPLEEQVEVCADCHGENGNSTTPEIPSLAGQPALTITNQMIYFRETLRNNDVMTPQAQGLSDAEIEALAAYYAKQPVSPAPDLSDLDSRRYEQGKTLAREMRCASCHRSDFSGNEQMPRLAGQREDYLIKAMKDYRERNRGGPDTTMIDILRDVSNEEIEALAHFLAHYESQSTTQ